MKKVYLFILLLLVSVMQVKAQKHIQYVDPRIGTEGLGRTFIGPSMPFGMVKPGPDCVSMPNAGWNPMPEKVKGFSQTHVSGTGGGQKYGNILIQPYIHEDGLTSYPQSRQKEQISLGYYSLTYDNGIRTEITTAERCALYRFCYPENTKHLLLVDCGSFLGEDSLIPNKREAQQFVTSDIKLLSENMLEGYTSVRGGWNEGDTYTVYFCLQSDLPFSGKVNIIRWKGKTYAKLAFEKKLANIKIGISYVSCDKARNNICKNDFDEQLAELHSVWNGLLSKIDIKATSQQKRMFYTAMYHTMLMPVDKSGENPKWQTVPYYDDYYAIWDTYRTSSPLLTLLCPDRERDIVNSLLNIYRNEGYMPDARSGDCNGRTQGGSNADIVIADAFARGLKGIDYELALQAMIKDAEVMPEDDEKEGRGGLEEYNSLGYIPYGIPRAGTRTVEYSFDDWCIAQVAKGLGHDDIYRKYIKRSHNWKNLWRSNYGWGGMKGFIMPRDAKGRWLDSVSWGKSKVYHPLIPYTPDTKVAPWYLPWWSTFFYEALSAEYSFCIPHDIPGLIEMCGGKEAFRHRLDVFFEKGYYNVANEPSFLTPCLYHWIGKPELSSARIHQIIRDNYSDRPDGLPGNDDSGAMSSWLIWNMLGIYPLAGTGEYLYNEPVVEDYAIHLADGKILRPRGAEKKTIPCNKPEYQEHTVKVPLVPDDIPQYEIHFTLNRQFRTWLYCYTWNNDKDTMMLYCNRSLYRIPRRIVEHGNGFCWNSAQMKGGYYDCDGTFCFISNYAMRKLKYNGMFVYNGMIWRQMDADGGNIHVKSDVDNAEMWINGNSDIPIVMKMKNNPLGIDWEINNKGL